MADAAKLLGDSWTLLILRGVSYGVTRFDDLRCELGISSATLSNRIAKLVDLGLLEKRQYQVPNARARTEYVLSQSGRGFGTVLFAMMRWADTYLGKEASPLDLVDPETGKVLDIALVDDQGAITDWQKAVPLVHTK
ncbi:MAG: helix-turn-helix domain-containing protein [Pseudomonadota bacterium]